MQSSLARIAEPPQQKRHTVVAETDAPYPPPPRRGLGSRPVDERVCSLVGARKSFAFGVVVVPPPDRVSGFSIGGRFYPSDLAVPRLCIIFVGWDGADDATPEKSKNMEFKEIIEKRRSVRKFTDRAVEEEIIQRLLHAALTAPSARNTRSTRLLVVDDPQAVARMADMRDYGAGFIKNAPMAILVMGDTKQSDLWRVNGSIAATMLQLACVDEGLASCWVHVDGRPRRKDAPDGESAADYLRGFLPIPEGCEPLCAIALGYSDFRPAPLPESDDAQRVIRLK